MNKKKLYKIKEGKKVCGVCTGLAEYLGVDVTLIRLLWVLTVLFLGVGVLAYLIIALILPSEPTAIREETYKEATEVEYKEI